MFSAPPSAKPKLSVPETRCGGFSLVELVIAIGIVSFALISIIGLVSVTVTTHANSSSDAVFSIMTETALQEVRNYNTAANSLYSGATSPYSFTKLATQFSTTTTGTVTTTNPGYIYFDVDGQITADSAATLPNNSQGKPNLNNSSSTAESTEMGYNTGISANKSLPGMPLTSPLTTLPTNTVYVCQITVNNQVTVAQSSTPGQNNYASTPTQNMYLVVLTFAWPAGATTANQHTRVVVSSISNNVN
jgi:Tfp pilus assembly protein PilV